MSVVFEDHATYDPKVDPVATVTLTVECNPGEVASITGFLVGTSSKAGVYSVAVDHVVHIPEKEVTGEADGEQPLQHAGPDGSGEDLGRQGSSPAEGGTAEIVDQHVEPELAGAAGESGTGSGSGSA